MIGDRLKELRSDAGMDQPQFAAIAGTSKQYVSQLESGRNVAPNAVFIERWATHFGVRMEWITSGTLPKSAAAPSIHDTAILALYHAMPPEQRAAWEAAGRAFVESAELAQAPRKQGTG